MIATLSLERDPPTFRDLWDGGFAHYLQTAGGLAAVGLAIFLLSLLLRRRRKTATSAPWQAWQWVFVVACTVAGIAYLVLAIAKMPEFIGFLSAYGTGQPVGRTSPALLGVRAQDVLFAVGGGCALLAVLLMPLTEALRWRWRRIWAVAKLCLKDAVRRKVLWVFLIISLLFLFGSWFMETKPEDQVRSYVSVVYLAMWWLLLVPIGLLAALSIPADIRSQTIHTVLTKPLERFELVLGRVVGYGLLMTMALLVLSGFCLLYLLREINPEAQYESLKARVPVYGSLQFYEEDTPKAEGENVGREWDYRRYIAGKDEERERNKPTQYAVWSFHEAPRQLKGRQTIPCEFFLDIYRTTKGEGVTCSFTFRARHAGDIRGQSVRETAFKKERDEETAKIGNDPRMLAFLDDWLAFKHGYYKRSSIPIVDGHTFNVEVPAALFRDPGELGREFKADIDNVPDAYKQLVVAWRKAGQQAPNGDLQRGLKEKMDDAERGMDADQRRRAFLFREQEALEARLNALERTPPDPKAPLVQVWVNCETAHQYVGMAKYDLYLLDGNQYFWINFLKGAAGLWLSCMLFIVLTVACGTYLSGIISWLATWYVLVLGYNRNFIQQLAEGKNDGGGPAESFLRLVSRQNQAAQLEETAATKVATTSDVAARWWMQRLLEFLPMPDRFSFTDYVAEGFNVPVLQIGYYLLLLGGYLLVWGLLAYYLIKWREIAGAT